MLIARKIAAVRSFWAHLRGKSLGFVPTMGDLHDGHLSLICRSKRENDFTAVSIFVNPTQFNQKNDFLNYHKDERRDLALLRQEKVDLVFLPSAKEMYKESFQTEVNVNDLSRGLCGPYRPGHLKGVSTVVAKLFSIVRPTRAYFGMKDFQQLKVIERMVQDLNLLVRIVACPTVREKDGLAMSSRNRRLSTQERVHAVKFSRALKVAARAPKPGLALFLKEADLYKKDVDYFEIVDPQTLLPKRKKPYVAAPAVRFGETRNI